MLLGVVSWAQVSLSTQLGAASATTPALLPITLLPLQAHSITHLINAPSFNCFHLFCFLRSADY
jgi:hypothetical protein